MNERERHAADGEARNSTIQRITHYSSTESILNRNQDIVIPVRLPRGFANYANDLISQSLADAGMSGAGREPTLTSDEPAEERADLHDFALYLWRVDKVTMWQQLDRRIDE